MEIAAGTDAHRPAPPRCLRRRTHRPTASLGNAFQAAEERMKGSRPARMPVYGAGSKCLGRTEKETKWRRFHAPQAPGNSHCAPTDPLIFAPAVYDAAMTRRHIRGRVMGRILVISVLTGALVSTLTNLSQGGDWRTWAEGGLVGLAIGLTILGIEVPFGERLERLPVSLRLFARMLLFGVGGFLGYLVGLFPTVVLVERATPEAALALYTRSHLLLGLIVTVPAALLVGGTMYTLERLRQRLAESISRLKETEFAEKELELARSIQKRLLPPAELSGDGFRVAARNFPARWVAGDFYDVFRLGDGHVGLVVADVAGKGIGGGPVMASGKAVLSFLSQGGTGGGEPDHGLGEGCSSLHCRRANGGRDAEASFGPAGFGALAT